MPDPTRALNVVQAICEALAGEMERDSRVLVIGEDVGKLGGVFRATDGLLERFGSERVVDMPMAELGIVGVAVGLAMRGLRPVAEIQFADFMHAAADHLIGEAAKIRYRSAGDWTCPLVVRTAYGGGLRGGPYHSQSIEALYAHTPGLKVVAPSFPADAKGLLAAAVRDPDPVLFLEHKRTYRAVTGPVPQGEYVVEIGRARRVRAGDFATVLAWGAMLHESLVAAEQLALEGIECEVIDLRTLIPFDQSLILESVRRTGRICVVHEDTRTMGFGAELVARVAELCLDDLVEPPLRITAPDVGGIPVADTLEDAILPDRKRIAQEIREAFSGRRRSTTRPAFDPTIPTASSVIEVNLPDDHLERLVDAVEAACLAYPECNAEFTWDGIRHHPRVTIDLDLGSRSPASGSGTITVSDYGQTSSVLALPAVRPGQTASVRVGAVHDGRSWVTLSVDHRAVNGATAGRFLEVLKKRVEAWPMQST
jgi:pyruvate/2-oxoglutarate/acetoin dehydrogenase E1 component